MKNLLIYILLILGAFTFFGCEDEDEIKFEQSDEYLQKGVNFRVQLDPDFANLDLGDIQNSEIRWDIYLESENIDEADISFTYFDASEDTTTGPFDLITYTQFDFDGDQLLDQVVTAQEIAGAAGISVDAFEGGDVINFFTNVLLEDGRLYPDTLFLPNKDTVVNVEAGILTGGNSSFTYNFVSYVACPTTPEEISGTYTAEIIESNFSSFVGNTNEVTISLVGPEPFRYRISDFTAEAYVPFGGSEYVGTFYDICGTAVFQPSSSFGVTIDTGGGSIDTDNGTIILKVLETNNQLTWTLELTKIND